MVNGGFRTSAISYQKNRFSTAFQVLTFFQDMHVFHECFSLLEFVM